MQKLQDTLINIWTQKLTDKFKSGFLVYERQLQAELYYQLKLHLNETYNIWIEPVVYLPQYGLNKVKPDICISKDDQLIAVIELKFKPWEDAAFYDDIEKLLNFDKAANANEEVTLGYIPISADWNMQQGGERVSYKINSNLLTSFVAFSKPNTNAVEPLSKVPQNFLHLYGFIDNYQDSVFSWRTNL